jgi:hypothetical protein
MKGGWRTEEGFLKVQKLGRSSSKYEEKELWSLLQGPV